MFELATDAKKKIRYEPIERRRKSRRSNVADRRADSRAEDGGSDRRQQTDRRKK